MIPRDPIPRDPHFRTLVRSWVHLRRVVIPSTDAMSSTWSALWLATDALRDKIRRYHSSYSYWRLLDDADIARMMRRRPA